jgi:hypothetical protein
MFPPVFQQPDPWERDHAAVRRVIRAIDAHMDQDLHGKIIALAAAGHITEHAEKVLLDAHHKQMHAFCDLVLQLRDTDDLLNAESRRN